MSLFDDKARLIEEAEAAFGEALAGVDEQLAMQIIRIYAKFVTDRRLNFDAAKMATLEADIVAAISRTDYAGAVNAYIPAFEAIKAMNTRIHRSVNKIDVNAVVNENVRIRNYINVVTSQLKAQNSTVVQYVEDGVVKTTKLPNQSLNELVQPIANLVRKDIISGVSFEAATDAMLEAINKKQLGLERWASTISRDALLQADGIMQAEIKEEFGLKWTRYIGGIRQGTRPFCYHLLTSKDEAIFSDEEISKALGEFCPGGVPSTVDYTYTPVSKTVTRQKGSGMIPGTDPTTFMRNRGGYQCHHQVIPARRP